MIQQVHEFYQEGGKNTHTPRYTRTHNPQKETERERKKKEEERDVEEDLMIESIR